MGEIDLMDPQWLNDPRRAAPKVLADVERAATLYAEAQHDAEVTRANMIAWKGTTMAALASKYSKWPLWRVESSMQADPKFRYWSMEVARADQAAEVAKGMYRACVARLELLGSFYHFNPGGS
jgi:hypothetical protein